MEDFGSIPELRKDTTPLAERDMHFATQTKHFCRDVCMFASFCYLECNQPPPPTPLTPTPPRPARLRLHRFDFSDSSRGASAVL